MIFVQSLKNTKPYAKSDGKLYLTKFEFNEIRSAKQESKERHGDIKSSVQSLHRLVWAGGGAVILFLAGIIAAGSVT
jgi:hypothetical protein